MLISKNQGEKLSPTELNSVLGADSCSCHTCGSCDCRSSNGENFYAAFDPMITKYDGILTTPAEP